MYSCKECGFVVPFITSNCKNCGAFDSFEQDDTIGTKKIKKGKLPKKFTKQNIGREENKRYLFEDTSLNELFGGGLTKGSINFLSAEPGAGKSTFLGQLGGLLKNKELKILYYSGEENTLQVWNRLERIYGEGNPLLNNIFLFYGEDYETFLALVEENKPDIVILDSLNAVAGESYTNQVNVLNIITSTLKSKSITGFVIGHINKAGEVAGKKTLEHIVDGIFMISGKDDRTDSIRILKVLKLRFGEANNIVIMKMGPKGFSIQNPKDSFKLFIEESSTESGSVFCPVLEGNQLLLIEVQSLVEEATYSYPQRVGLGINKQKLDIILATINKSLKIDTVREGDVFVKILSPFTFKNIHLDLAVAMSIMSAVFKKDFKQYIFVGELGLAGEIRTIPKQEEIIRRLIKLGFKKENIISREQAKNIATLLKEVLLNI